MTPSAWIALAAFALTLIFNGIALAIGYGVLKGTVTALAARVKVLEQEMGAITELKVAVGKIESKQDAMFEQLRDLAASVRWMREPAPSELPPRRTRRTGE